MLLWFVLCRGLTDDFRVQLQSAPGAAPSKEQLSELQANFEATTIAPREAPAQSQAIGPAPTATLVPKHAPAPVPAPAPTQFVPPVAQPYQQQQQQAPIQQPHPQPAIPQQPQAAPAPVPAPAPAVQQAPAAAPVSVAGLEEDIYNKFLDPLRSLNDAENVVGLIADCPIADRGMDMHRVFGTDGKGSPSHKTWVADDQNMNRPGNVSLDQICLSLARLEQEHTLASCYSLYLNELSSQWPSVNNLTNTICFLPLYN